LDGIERSQLAFLAFALTTQARVQAHRSSVLALNKWVPRAMDHHSIATPNFETLAAKSGKNGFKRPGLSETVRSVIHLVSSREWSPEEIREAFFRTA
jgi:hypothetical protein